MNKLTKQEVMFQIHRQAFKADFVDVTNPIRQDSVNQIKHVLNCNFNYLVESDEVSEDDLNEVMEDIEVMKSRIQALLDDPWHLGTQGDIHDTLPPPDHDRPTDPSELLFE